MQAGTNSSTQAMPLVRLSEDDLFPAGDSGARILCEVHPSGRSGQCQRPVAEPNLPRQSGALLGGCSEDTRTMHTEVDVPNPGRILLPGLYAEATITLEKKRRRNRGAPAGGGSGQ